MSHHNKSATISAECVRHITTIVGDCESVSSNIIHARAVVYMLPKKPFIQLDHTTLHIINAALTEVITATPLKASPYELLRCQFARKVLEVIDLHTTSTAMASNGLTTGKYVCLEGIEHGNRFFSSYSEEHDATKLSTGETAYKILGYANTIDEAQALIGLMPDKSFLDGI